MVHGHCKHSVEEVHLMIEAAADKVAQGETIDEEELRLLQLSYPKLHGPRFLERLRSQLVHLRVSISMLMRGGPNRSPARPQGKVSKKTRENRNRLRKVVFPKRGKNRY